ncbi:MAG TPA: hypothetical protein PKZ32_09545, partial [Candidatus Melainabacteria bacterium]|nr:hypothetical protein [Candidatus Melainabacteria bacterium]
MSPSSKSQTLITAALVAVLITLVAAATAFAQELRQPRLCGAECMTNLLKAAQEYDKTIKKEHLEAIAEALSKLPPEKLKAGIVLKARFNEAERMIGKMNQPRNTAPAAKATGQAQATQAGNSAADIARDQGCAAIDYCSRFLKNFTTEGGNRWNRFRDGVFVPIGILFLLPGAVMSQMRA